MLDYYTVKNCENYVDYVAMKPKGSYLWAPGDHKQMKLGKKMADKVYRILAALL